MTTHTTMELVSKYLTESLDSVEFRDLAERALQDEELLKTLGDLTPLQLALADPAFRQRWVERSAIEYTSANGVRSDPQPSTARIHQALNGDSDAENDVPAELFPRLRARTQDSMPFEVRPAANPQTENSAAERSAARSWTPWLATAATVIVAVGAVVQLARERGQNAALRAQLETSSRPATFLLLGTRPVTRGLRLPSVRLGDPTLLLLQTETSDAGEFVVEINESGVQRLSTVVRASPAMALNTGFLLVVPVPVEILRAGTEYEVTWRRVQADDVARAFFLVEQS